MSKRVTLNDVAEKVGVSSQTVSRAINNKPDVSEETRRQVWQAAKALGYRPNAVARSLSARRSHTLGIITPPLTDQFYAMVIANLEKEARQRGYISFVSFVDNPEEDSLEIYDLMLQRQVDGLVLLTPGQEPYRQVEFSVPVISLAMAFNQQQVINVDVDNVDGAYQAVRHLVNLGHKHVGMVTGPLTYKAARDRLEGARRALAESGLSLNDNQIQECPEWFLESGYQAALKLLSDRPDLTALFCHNDWLALGAYRAARERKRCIPQDLSIVGYDNAPICLYVNPTLSSVQQPKVALGRLLAQLLVDAIERGVNGPQDMVLRVELVTRESVAPPG